MRKKEVKGPGSPLLMTVGGGNEEQAITGTLESFDIRVDPQTGTVRAYGVFPNHDRLLLPGMFANVRLTFGQVRALLHIPQSAIFNVKGKHGIFVHVVNGQGTVCERPVELFQRDGGQWVVEKGLQADDVVVIEGLSVRDGERIKPEYRSSGGTKTKK